MENKKDLFTGGGEDAKKQSRKLEIPCLSNYLFTNSSVASVCCPINKSSEGKRGAVVMVGVEIEDRKGGLFSTPFTSFVNV